MSEKYTVSLDKIIKQYNLEAVNLPEKKVEVEVSDIHRSGLPLTGFYNHFDPLRIHILGMTEYSYLNSFDDEKTKNDRIDCFFAHKPVAIIITSGLDVFDSMKTAAEKYDVPLLRTDKRSSEFMGSIIAYLSVKLAPRITRHGVLVEVYGEGMLILGDSGVGKSETAIELVKRGHRLIADDAVEIKRVSDKTLVGEAPEIIRHYVELRGIGVVDVRRIFGMGAVKETEKIDMIIKLEPWVQGKMYDRFGLESEYTNIMGIDIPTTTIPVKPGRNLAIILEIAAMNNRQKKMGYNTAVEFNNRLMKMGLPEE